MSVFLKQLISASVIFVITCAALGETTPKGFVQGNLTIVSPREVELADAAPSAITVENYSDYPLVILSRDRKKEVAHVTAEKNGSYRVALAPGDYVLDVQDHKRRHFRATPQRFTVVSNQTVHVDMNIDTGIR